jgi:hypothetical protein
MARHTCDLERERYRSALARMLPRDDDAEPPALRRALELKASRQIVIERPRTGRNGNSALLQRDTQVPTFGPLPWHLPN